MMDVLLAVCALTLAIIGIIGCVVPVLPGPLLSYGALLCTWGTAYSHISSTALWIWLALTLVVTAADYYLPALMTRRFGGSRAGAIGATLGVFVGLFLYAPVGILIGPFAGAVLGELLHDSSDPGKAVRVGFGSFVAFILGTGAKLCLSFGILVLVLADIWPALKTWFMSLF